MQKFSLLLLLMLILSLFSFEIFMQKTIIQWIQDVEKALMAADLFYGHGTDNAWDEAVQIVLFGAGYPANSGRDIENKLVEEKESAAIEELLRKRTSTRKPLAYLTQEAWFAGLPFYVDERVLIPRSPFAEWITRRFQPWVTNPEHVQHILEIGTGSGCMAIVAALAFEHAQIDAVDINSEALMVARQNVSRYQLEDRVHLHESDCFSRLTTKSYDIIMSNPPYVSANEMQQLPPEYQHEPIQALQADDRGLAIVQRILQQASNYLTDDGILVVEVGNSEQALIERYPAVPFIWLEMEHGGQGLFLLTANDCRTHFGSDYNV